MIDTSEKARVKISYLGNNFKEKFLNKIEEEVSQSILRYQDLKNSSRDILIINEIGGETVAETTLSKMFALMEMQSESESGALLTNGYVNIFYIRDVTGVLWAVYCYWLGDGWFVVARSVEYPNGWSDGLRVFSRNS